MEQELLITGCSDPLLWYAGMVGQRVPYLGQFAGGDREYRSVEPAGYSNVVKSCDALIVPKEAPPSPPGPLAEVEATAHWNYVASVLRAHNADWKEILLAEHHYKAAFVHGWKHGVESATGSALRTDTHGWKHGVESATGSAPRTDTPGNYVESLCDSCEHEGEGAMSDEEKLMALFTKIHGEITGSCYTEIIYDEDHKVFAVDVMKDGNLCWRATKVDLLFDIIDTTFPTSIAQKMREKFEIEI